MNTYRNNPEGEENQQATRDNENYVKSLKFDRHALDDGQAHAAHLKVGGLETPCELKQHAGDCTIYRALINGRPYDGICTCGYGWELVRKSDYSEMLSGERMGALMQATIADPNKPSQWATKAETRIMQLAGIPGIENFSVAVEIQHAIDQACAERDAEIEKLSSALQAALVIEQETVIAKDAEIVELQLKLGNCQCCSCDHGKCQEIAAQKKRIDQLEQTASEWWNALASRETEIRERNAEIARLKAALAGLTPEAIHSFCHDLEARVPAAEFAEGCMAYQEKLYGSSPMRALLAEVSQVRDALLAEGSALKEQNRSLRTLLERVPHIHPLPPPSIADEYPECVWSATCVRCAYEMTLAHEKLAREAKAKTQA